MTGEEYHHFGPRPRQREDESYGGLVEQEQYKIEAVTALPGGWTRWEGTTDSSLSWIDLWKIP